MKLGLWVFIKTSKAIHRGTTISLMTTDARPSDVPKARAFTGRMSHLTTFKEFQYGHRMRFLPSSTRKIGERAC